MRLGGNARYMVTASTPEDIAKVYEEASKRSLPVFVLGGGSNLIVKDEGFSGIVILNRVQGFEVLDDDGARVMIKVGGGEDWDGIVRRTVEMNLSGIEAMSGIPGTAGAAPVQNIGAYGQEIAETLISLEAYDRETGRVVMLENADCSFSYRHSIFRGRAAGRYIITSITIGLYKAPTQPPFYKAVEDYFSKHNITTFTPQIIRDAVLHIRDSKLPDPKKQPNAGSFFKNALVEPWQVNELKQQYQDMPAYEMSDGHYKIPTGWLIEQTGLKGKIFHGFRVHTGNALVLINESARSYRDLAAARDVITGAVRDKFRISIEQEPLEL